MIRDVKIFLAKIKDGKGKDLYVLNKKSLATKIPPKSVKKRFQVLPEGLFFQLNQDYERKRMGS